MKKCKKLIPVDIIEKYGYGTEVWIAEFEPSEISSDKRPHKIKPIKAKFFVNKEGMFDIIYYKTEYGEFKISFMFNRRFYVSENFDEVNDTFYSDYNKWIIKRKDYLYRTVDHEIKELNKLQISNFKKATE